MRPNNQQQHAELSFEETNMRLKKGMISLGIIFSTVFAMVGIVTAQGMGPGRPGGPGMMGQQGPGPRGPMRSGGRMRGPRRMKPARGVMSELRGLNLTEGQRAQIKSILESNRPSEAERSENQEIMRAIRSGTATEQQRARAKEIAAKKIDDNARVRQQVRGVLTPDQIETLQKREQLKEERRTKMKDRRKARQPRQ